MTNMPLDPQVERLLKEMALKNDKPVYMQTPEEARAARLALLDKNPQKVRPVGSVKDQLISGSGTQIPIRIYTPGNDGLFPIMVYFHGGGWVIGNLNTVDDTCRAICTYANYIVVSVDYRLAPEHKFPSPVEDAYDALLWAVQHADQIGGTKNSVVVAGDSAGATLAAVTARKAKENGYKLLGQLLIYPVTQHAFDTNSYEENASGYFLTKKAMEWYWSQYLNENQDGRSADASPLLAPNLKGLPQAIVLTAEFDPLRDEGNLYAERLKQAGVSVIELNAEGMIHGFFTNEWGLDRREQVLRQVANLLKEWAGDCFPA